MAAPNPTASSLISATTAVQIGGSIGSNVNVTQIGGQAVVAPTPGVESVSLRGKSNSSGTEGDTSLLNTPAGCLLVSITDTIISNSLIGGGQPVGVRDTSDTNRLLAVMTFGATNASNNADAARFANVFRSAAASAAGDTAVWTPSAGKKFRVMGVLIEVTGEAALAAAADLVITLRDATTDTAITASCYVPAAAPANPAGTLLSIFIPLSNGRLSAAANNVLNVNLSAALTAGQVRCTVQGTEE